MIGPCPSRWGCWASSSCSQGQSGIARHPGVRGSQDQTGKLHCSISQCTRDLCPSPCKPHKPACARLHEGWSAFNYFLFRGSKHLSLPGRKPGLRDDDMVFWALWVTKGTPPRVCKGESYWVGAYLWGLDYSPYLMGRRWGAGAVCSAPLRSF